MLKEGEEKKEDGTRARKFPRDGPDQRGSLPGDLTLQDDIESQESPNARRAFSRPAGGGGSPFPFLEGEKGGGGPREVVPLGISWAGASPQRDHLDLAPSPSPSNRGQTKRRNNLWDSLLLFDVLGTAAGLFHSQLTKTRAHLVSSPPHGRDRPPPSRPGKIKKGRDLLHISLPPSPFHVTETRSEGPPVDLWQAGRRKRKLERENGNGRRKEVRPSEGIETPWIVGLLHLGRGTGNQEKGGGNTTCCTSSPRRSWAGAY